MPNPNLASLVQTEMAVSLLGRLVRSSGILMDTVNNWNSLVTELQSAGEAYHFSVPLRQVRLQPDIEEVEWEEVRLAGPYIEDKHTLSQLARMTGNAYALPGQKNWYDIDVTWNTVRPVPPSRSNGAVR